MRLFEIGNTTIRCSPVLLIIIPFVIIFNAVGEMLTALLSLSLHEACHTLVAWGLGYRVSSIEIQPFGFVARLETMIFSPIDEIAIAAAGPVCSLVIAAVASAFFKSTPGSLHAFAQCNLALGAINLLPALPLDGGRITKAILSLCIRSRIALLFGAVCGILCGVMILGLGIISLNTDEWNLSALIMGIFLVLAAIREICLHRTARLNAMIRQRVRMRTGEGMKIAETAIHGSVLLGDALHFCFPGRYNLLLIVDDAMRSIGQLDEPALLDGIAKYGVQCSVSELLKRVH